MDVGTVSVGVIGGAPEPAALAAIAREIENGSAALVLEGDAGVGKTTLWRAALRSTASTRRCAWAVCARPPSMPHNFAAEEEFGHSSPTAVP